MGVERGRVLLPFCGQKGPGEPWGLEAQSHGGGDQSREKWQSRFQPISPPAGPGHLLSAPPSISMPNTGASHRPPHQLPTLPSLQPAPFPGKDPSGGPSCSSRCEGSSLGEGRMGSLAPNLLHHPQMMKPCERFWQGCGLGSEDGCISCCHCHTPRPSLTHPHR